MYHPLIPILPFFSFTTPFLPFSQLFPLEKHYSIVRIFFNSYLFSFLSLIFFHVIYFLPFIISLLIFFFFFPISLFFLLSKFISSPSSLPFPSFVPLFISLFFPLYSLTFLSSFYFPFIASLFFHIFLPCPFSHTQFFLSPVSVY